MTAATTVLLRSVARLCGADAAVVECGGEVCAYGIATSVASDAVACVRANEPLADGRVLLCELAIPLARPDRDATLYLFDRTVKSLDTRCNVALRIIATEIGNELGTRTVSQREQPREDVGVVLARLANAIDSLNEPAAIFEWPHAGSEPRIRYVNVAFEMQFGYEAVIAIGQTAHLLHGPLTDIARVEFLNERMRASREARSPIVYYGREGVPIWIELSLRAAAGTNPSDMFVVATMRDVTTRKEFELAIGREKRKLQVTLAAIGDGVITTVADGRVDFVNNAARTMFDIDAAEAYGESISDALALTTLDGQMVDVLQIDAESDGVRRGQVLFNGRAASKHIAFVTSPIGNEGYVVVLRDVSAAHRLATQLSYEASHDPLTNMYNRRKFDEVLNDAIESAGRREGPHALAYLDLDRFKYINDRCGHAVGDRVLLDLSHLLQQQLRGRDVLARLGGDEFAVLLHECSLENARRVLEKLRVSVDSYRMVYQGEEYGLGVSIGIAEIDGNEHDAGVIYACADAACYAAKSRGRNSISG